MERTQNDSQTPKKVTLNRAVFAARPHDSNALTCLDTLLHRFNDAGDFAVFIHRGARMIRRLTVQVTPDNAAAQHNIDLAALEKQDCACHSADTVDYTLKAGGVLGFYVSSGIASYSISVRRASTAKDAPKEGAVIFDSSKGVAAGDFFAATLVRPGLYRVREQLSKAEATIQVNVPPVPTSLSRKPDTGKSAAKKGETKTASATPVYRPDRPQLFDFGPKGFGQKELQIFSGQSVVVRCGQIAQLHFELEKPDKVTTVKSSPFHYQKPAPKTARGKKS